MCWFEGHEWQFRRGRRTGHGEWECFLATGKKVQAPGRYCDGDGELGRTEESGTVLVDDKKEDRDLIMMAGEVGWLPPPGGLVVNAEAFRLWGDSRFAYSLDRQCRGFQ